MQGTFTRMTVLVVFLTLLAGCKMHQTAPRPTIPLVERILGDLQSPEHKMLVSFDAADTHGDIVLLDSPERCFDLSERFVTCDDRDNVDGLRVPDELPDFAGERITSILDIVYTPYERFVSAGNADALREVTVRAVVSAMDTVCSLGPFDHEQKSRKPSAKLLVISSPYLAACGGFDVDTLFRSTAGAVPVLSGPEVMMARVMDARDGASNICILSDSAAVQSGVYQTVFKELCRKRGDRVSTLSAFALPDGFASDSLALSAAEMPADAFKLILDQYARSGRSTALNAIVVDDFRFPIDVLRASYAEILNHPSEENAFYRKMLSKDFEFIDGAQAVTDACYRYLREKNLFTHHIAYPVAAAFLTSPESKSYMLTDFDIHTLPAEMGDLLQSLAPATFKMYVQDQHHARGN